MRRRRVVLVGVASLLAALLVGVGGCSILGSSQFEPAVATPGMAAQGLVSRWAELPGEPVPAEKIHYVASGPVGAPPVLFVHGSPGTWEAWRGYLTDPALAGRARLLAPDRPGFGGSSRGRAEGSLDDQARALVAVLDADGARAPAVVVGHSLGGPVAAALAVAAPERVAALLLVAPSIDPDLERRRWFNVVGSWRAVQLLLPVDWITSNREIWPLRGELAALAPRLAEVRCPVVVVQGGADKLVPAANDEFVERAFTAAPVRVDRYPELGHFLLWQQPEIVRQALAGLLAGASPELAAAPPVYRSPG